MAKHWHSSKTQIYWTCKALIEGRVITHVDEIGEAMGWRLSSIIHRLRHHFDWPILTEYRGPENIAHYSLSPYCDKQRLKWPRSAQRLAPDNEKAGPDA